MRHIAIVRSIEMTGPAIDSAAKKGYDFVSMSAVQQAGAGMPINVVILLREPDKKK